MYSGTSLKDVEATGTFLKTHRSIDAVSGIFQPSTGVQEILSHRFNNLSFSIGTHVEQTVNSTRSHTTDTSLRTHSLVSVLRNNVYQGLYNGCSVLVLARFRRAVEPVAIRIHPFARLPFSGLRSAKCGIFWCIKIGNDTASCDNRCESE
jgi:hypothetical protein